MTSQQEEYEELKAAKALIESEIFQKFFVKPLKEKRDSLRTAFFSDSLKESWRKGGKQEGMNEFFTILKQIPIDLKNKIYELEDSARGR